MPKCFLSLDRCRECYTAYAVFLSFLILYAAVALFHYASSYTAQPVKTTCCLFCRPPRKLSMTAHHTVRRFPPFYPTFAMRSAPAAHTLHTLHTSHLLKNMLILISPHTLIKSPPCVLQHKCCCSGSRALERGSLTYSPSTLRLQLHQGRDPVVLGPVAVTAQVRNSMRSYI